VNPKGELNMENLPETNEILIARVKDRSDDQAWSEFLAIYQPVILRLARRRGLQDADAHDVCQKVVFSVSQAIGRWEPRPNQPFRAWLGRIARNSILNALTRRPPDIGSALSDVADLLNQIPEKTNPESKELHQETQRQLFRRAARAIKSEFQDSTWKMFWRTEVLDEPVHEVAMSLGCTTGAIYVSRCRIMKRLREAVRSESSIWSESAIESTNESSEEMQ